MSLATKILLGGGVSCVVFALFLGFAVFGIKNTCVVQTNAVEAQYQSNKIALAGYTNKIMDLVQVPDMAKDAIKEVATAAIQGRYGKDGSKAVFQMITEQNPTVDSNLYRNLMEAMEAGRNGFDADQVSLQAKCQAFRDYFQRYPQAMFTGMLGYPHADFEEHCKPVTTEQTEHDFKTHTTGPLKLHPATK